MLFTHEKKPTQVKLIQLKELLELDQENDIEIRETPSSEYEVYNKLHQSWIKLELEDYINITTPGDYYPIKKHIVEASYIPLEN